MSKDHIIEEVRKHRREIENECNNDFSLLFAKAKETEKKMKDIVVSNISKRKKSLRRKEWGKIGE